MERVPVDRKENGLLYSNQNLIDDPYYHTGNRDRQMSREANRTKGFLSLFLCLWPPLALDESMAKGRIGSHTSMVRSWTRHSRYLRRCARWRGSLQVSRVAISEAPEMRNPTCTQTHSITPVRDDKRETSKARMMCVGLLLIFLYRKLIFFVPERNIFSFVCVKKSPDL